MSSRAYAAQLEPDPGVRRTVFLTGAVLYASGAAAILGLPLPPDASITAALGWLAAGLWQLARRREDAGRIVRLRVSGDGSVRVLDRSGDWRRGKLEDGSMLIGRRAWLRLRIEGAGGRGPVLSEAFAGGPGDPEWRRLAVIWRHLGAPE